MALVADAPDFAALFTRCTRSRRTKYRTSSAVRTAIVVGRHVSPAGDRAEQARDRLVLSLTGAAEVVVVVEQDLRPVHQRAGADALLLATAELRR